MASLKEVKNRISSVKSTRQITSAMKMVASAKLHKAQGRIENMLPYQRKLNEILTNFLSTDATIESPYTDERPVGRVAIGVLVQFVIMRGFQLQCGEDAGAHAGRVSIIGPGEYSDISRRQESGGGRKKAGICAAGQLSGNGGQTFIHAGL